VAKPETILLDGHAYSWQQLEAWRVAQPRQIALFELKNDTRPVAERTASGRYEQPSLLGYMRERTR
jgi:hypothetical protein